jgi:hypothetical protein
MSCDSWAGANVLHFDPRKPGQPEQLEVAEGRPPAGQRVGVPVGGISPDTLLNPLRLDGVIAVDQTRTQVDQTRTSMRTAGRGRPCAPGQVGLVPVSLIRRGERTPHPRHWRSLQDIAEVAKASEE